MLEKAIRAFATKLGVRLGKLNDRGWIEARCPLAVWTHPKRASGSYTFGIVIDHVHHSTYHCWSCHHKGTLPDLAFKLARFRGDKDLIAIGREIETAEILGSDDVLPDWDDASYDPPDDGVSKVGIAEIGFTEALGLYPPVEQYPAAVRYLYSRGVHYRTMRMLNLRFDPDQSRVLFPVIDQRQVFRGFVGRAIYKSAKLRVKDYFGLPKRALLLGEHSIAKQPCKHLHSNLQKIVVVEGPMDYARARQWGYRALCLFGSGLTREKEETLLNLGRPIIWLTDPDAAGAACIYGPLDKETEQHQFNEGALYKLYGKIPQFIVPDWETVISDLPDEPDPAKLSQVQFAKLLKSAELFIRE